jgi:hypothetical protein
MAWKESPSAWRTTPRPSGWKSLRARALARDEGRCTWLDDGHRCEVPATDVDHIGAPDDHSLENLRALCAPHHRRRTALQARAARGELPSRRRPQEQHPGLIQSKPSDPIAEARRKALADPDRPGF